MIVTRQQVETAICDYRDTAPSARTPAMTAELIDLLTLQLDQVREAHMARLKLRRAPFGWLRALSPNA